MARWSDRTRQFPDGSIEQRLEQVTLSCLETLLADLNDGLRAQAKRTLRMDDMMPTADAAKPRVQHGLHPIVQQMAVLAMSRWEPLDLPASDRLFLRRIEKIIDDRLDVMAEVKALMDQHPQLKGIPGCETQEGLYRTIWQSVDRSLEEYLTNGPKQPLQPPKGASR